MQSDETDKTFDLPEKFIRTITGMFGKKGVDWLGELPKITGTIAKNWSLNVGKPFANLSYHYVAPCICGDGSEAVLKIGFPEERLEFFSEVKMLRLYGGNGAVRILRSDEALYAMLLEKVAPGKGLGELCLKDDGRAVEIAVGVLKKIARKAESGMDSDGDFHLLENWIGGFRRAKNTEFPAAIIKKAQDFFAELAGVGAEKFLLHGDFHHENILSAVREPFLVIDPKGLVGGIGYDIGVFLNNHRNWLEGVPRQEEKLDRSVTQFAEAFAMDESAVRKWAFIQMVLSAWWTFEENDERWKIDLSKAEVWRV